MALPRIGQELVLGLNGCGSRADSTTMRLPIHQIRSRGAGWVAVASCGLVATLAFLATTPFQGSDGRTASTNAFGTARNAQRGLEAPTVASSMSGAHTSTRAIPKRSTTTTDARPPKSSVTDHAHGGSGHAAQMPTDSSHTPDTIASSGIPSTVPTVIQGGSTHGGVYCNGWITRIAPPSHLTIYDATHGRTPTIGDCANAHAFYGAVVTANSKYGDINVAIANNFRPGGDPAGQYAQHYVNWNKTPGVADPNNPEGLVYHFDAAGHATLLGIYFFETTSPLVQPAGPLTVWHSHMPTSARMLHVWTFPGCRDPFAFMISGAM